MVCQRTKRCSLRLALALLLLTGGIFGAVAQGNAFEQPTLPEAIVIKNVSQAPAEEVWQPMQSQTAPQPMQPTPPFGQPPQGQLGPGGNMPSGVPSPIDGYWFSMTQQGPVMMGLQNGAFLMMGANQQIFGQGTFIVQGQQIISTLPNGQQEIFDFQSDGMTLQLRDPKTGGSMVYQKVPNQPGYQPPNPYQQPGYSQPQPYMGQPNPYQQPGYPQPQPYGGQQNPYQQPGYTQPQPQPYMGQPQTPYQQPGYPQQSPYGGQQSAPYQQQPGFPQMTPYQGQ